MVSEGTEQAKETGVSVGSLRGCPCRAPGEGARGGRRAGSARVIALRRLGLGCLHEGARSGNEMVVAIDVLTLDEAAEIPEGRCGVQDENHTPRQRSCRR